MYLKSIQAHGFKSFADKINIELHEGITGVVGPNGSGKSNVVDAVRWVLGEQSVKSLRGEGAMTDVIFSGSKSRNPLNVASVTLVFDNHDHYLPIDYEEVSVKRRVYKDGTNEYYLNEEKVRLKDIVDLLLDSGIAKESFNIISQGKIEEILSNKPTDRRVIFEEAAGVLKYKRRKEEAMRKLEKTHDNMNRIHDIIGEMESQVEPLREQKEKALCYRDAQEELEGIEVALITNDITTMNYTYQDKKGQIERLNREILELSTTNRSNEAKIEDYKLKIHKLEEEIQKKQHQLLEATTEAEKINSQKKIILERQKYAVADTKVRDHILHLKEEQYQSEIQLHHLELELASLQEEQKTLDLKVADIEKCLLESKRQKQEWESHLTAEVRKNSFLKSGIEQLRDSIEHNSTVPLAVRKVLDNPKLAGIHNVLGNLIEVDPQYSLSIATALGASSSNIVVDNEQAAKEAITYLKGLAVGRATFFPLNVIRPRMIPEEVIKIVQGKEGFIGIASMLVRYKPIYRDIILNQLGNILVVDTLDHAASMAAAIHHNYRIVTLEGEVLHVGGSLTGGTSKNRNMIQDKYELDLKIRDFEKSNHLLEQWEQKMNQQDEEIRAIEDRLYLANKERVENQTVLEEKVQSKRNLTLKRVDIENEIQGAGNLINHTLKEEEENAMQAYYAALLKKDELTHLCQELQAKKQSLQEELEEYDFSLKRENSLFNVKNKELKELEIDVNRMDVKLDSLLHTLNETYNMTYERASSLYKLELDETVARSKVNGLRRKIKELGVVNMTAPEEYDRVSARYEFMLKQREDLVKAENTLLEIIEEMDAVMKKDFTSMFNVVQENFRQTFRELFKGGTAELKLTDPEHLLETGIEIIASPPGKKLSSISLLSGGEKTFTAISLLFAILKSRPMPFCILDEVEAALDEVNVDSFGQYLSNLKEKTQFIMITHKKKTMEYADILYGITMQESGVSKLVSVKLEEMK